MKVIVDTNVVAFYLLETEQFIHDVRAFWRTLREPIAPTRSIQSGVAVYDTLFVELAEREGLSLATFDKRLLAAFPRIAKRPRDILRKRIN